MEIYPENIWRQLLNDAPFQWFLRDQASLSLSYSVSDLQYEDEKTEAFFDALKMALREEGVDLSKLPLDDTGAVFVFSVLGLRLDSYALIDLVLESIEESDEKSQELFQAFSWQVPSHEQIRYILKHKSPYVRQALIAAFPSDIEESTLNKWLRSTDEPIVFRLLGYLGDNRKKSQQQYVSQFYQSDNKKLQLAAGKTGVLLGDKHAMKILKQYAAQNNPFLREALLWLFCFSKPNNISAYVDNILNMKISPRIQALSIAYSGMSHYVPHLFSIMEDINFAQVAAESFSLLTGVDIVEENLDMNAPEGDEPTAAEKRNIDDQYQDYEEDLPWPNIELLQIWWKNNQHKFDKSQHYLAGVVINQSSLLSVLQSGVQKHRHIAALHMAKLNSQQTVLSISSKVAFQQQALT